MESRVISRLSETESESGRAWFTCVTDSGGCRVWLKCTRHSELELIKEALVGQPVKDPQMELQDRAQVAAERSGTLLEIALRLVGLERTPHPS